MNVKRNISGSPRKQSKKLCVDPDLIGQLTALSHILNVVPRSIILELCTKESVHYIICEHLECILLKETLNIGLCYKFSKLLPKVLKVKGKAVSCFKCSVDTTWCEIKDIGDIHQLPYHAELVNLQGKVTEMNHQLGICTLDDSRTVIISTCSRIALMTFPKEGQNVTIFNAHRIEPEKGRLVYALCVKSYLSVDQEDCKTPETNLSPLLLALGNSFRGYRLILWLQDCSNAILKSFSDDFLSSYIPLNECNDFRSNLLTNIAKFVVNKCTVHEKSIIDEFFALDHTCHCGTLKNEFVLPSFPNLLDFNNENPDLEDEFDENGSNVFWQYDVKNCSRGFLVGLLIVKNASHRLTFTDALGSIACLLMAQNGQILEGKDLTRINKKLVLISNYNVVQEKFSWQQDHGSSQTVSRKVKCLAVSVDKVHIVSTFTGAWKRVSEEDLMFTPPGVDQDSPGKKVKNGVGANSYGIQAKMDAASETTCISPLKYTPLVQYMSQYIYIQTKTTPCAPKAGKSARCCLLVSLLGEMVSVTSPSKRGSSTKTIFIALECSLLGAHPLITVNTVYEVRLPNFIDKSFFENGLPMSSLLGLKKMLPTISCVTLPDNCEIHLVSDYPVPSKSLKLRDCYGIDQAIKEANVNELINIKGYIVERFHQNPRYDREKLVVRVHGFGIPDLKIIALVLRDTPPESQTGTPATIYLSTWCTLQYPFALVPGAQVVFRFVTKVIPQSTSKGSTYFRTSVLSSIEVLELKNENSDDKQGRRNLLGPRSVLAAIVSEKNVGCNWITISMTDLRKISFWVNCSSCNHPFANGTCSFVGCVAPPNPTIFSQACFRVSDFGCSAFVFVPNALVKKLFIGSEKIWVNIVTLTESVGHMEYSIFEERSHLSVEQRVFGLLCSSLLKGQRFHLLCRPFNNQKDNKFPALPVLYAVDIYPVTLLTATS